MRIGNRVDLELCRRRLEAKGTDGEVTKKLHEDLCIATYSAVAAAIKAVSDADKIVVISDVRRHIRNNMGQGVAMLLMHPKDGRGLVHALCEKLTSSMAPLAGFSVVPCRNDRESLPPMKLSDLHASRSSRKHSQDTHHTHTPMLIRSQNGATVQVML